MAGARDRAGIEVVALVASAGGLDALSAVLRGLPVDLPTAVLVQQHLGAKASVLPEILERRLGRAVVWAEHGAPVVVPGRVMVSPPRTRVEVLPDGTCSFTPSESPAERPHDSLLASLADSFRDRALAVVLSGTGSDGARGTAALVDAGGVVIAQSEDTADYPSMPRAAAAAGADLVLPLHEIAGVVVDVVRGGPVPRAKDELDAVRATFGDEGQIAQLARELDWASTPVGRVSEWSPVLRTVVRLAMSSPDPVAILWGQDYFVFVNDAAIPPLSGRHRHAFGRPHREAFPEVWDQVRLMFADAVRGDRLVTAKARLPFERAGSMEDAWFDLSHTPIRDANGSVAGIYQVFFDRTQEVLAARRMQTLNRLSAIPAARGRREAAEAVLAVLAQADDVLFAVAYLIDPIRRRADLVGAVGVDDGGPMAPRELQFVRGTGWPVQQVVEDDRSVTIDDLAVRFRGHTVGPEQLTPQRAVLHALRDEADDRTVGVLVLGVHPRLPLDQRYSEFLTVVAETTAGRLAESHARQREHERLERLAELDKAKTNFFSNVSHEFRTPLTLMLAPLEDLRGRSDLPADAATELDLVQRSTRRLLRLVGTLLDFSQAEAGRLRAHFAPTDLPALTAEIVSMFRGAAEAAGLKLTLDAPPLPEPVWVDPEMWEKIVSNLVSNALKFTWHGEVTVTLRALPRHAELVVHDTGVGIPEEELPYIFRRFHRIRETRGRTHEGAGIGLALVDELVRRHHGRVRVASEQGAGSTFTVWMPRGQRPADAVIESPPAGGIAALMAEEALHWDAARERNQAALGLDVEPVPDQRLSRRAVGARVLIVDDNPDMRDYLGRLLGGDWRVTEAGSGEEALQLARRDRPDLILTDVMMPGMDGFALLRTLRGDEKLAWTPVVLVTARAGEETAIDGLLAGADDYVVKPFSARELLARVGAQLELARLRRQNERRFRALIDASWDVVYRMSPDWTEMRTLAGRGFIADTDQPSTGWLDNYIHPDDQPHVTATIQRAIRTRSVFELEHRVRRPDGSLGWTLSRAIPLLDDDGQIIEWVGAASDVTAQHTPPEL